MELPPEENKLKDDASTQPTMLGGVVDLFKANLGDASSYIILSMSLIWSFFSPFWGQLPVGVILGLYFSTYTISQVKQFKEFLVAEGIFRGFIIIAAIASLVICAPGLMCGLCVGVGARAYIERHGQDDSQE